MIALTVLYFDGVVVRFVVVELGFDFGALDFEQFAVDLELGPTPASFKLTTFAFSVSNVVVVPGNFGFINNFASFYWSMKIKQLSKGTVVLVNQGIRGVGRASDD